MAKLSHSDSRRMYSWWWDSHISPKNSKWLQENLTDMDAKVKSMIKLIEEDADSFARRAEMYYKKRPELMKLVEEFYRAYRALAERYDHATGVIRHAHRTMSEAFPNQVPMMFGDDSPASSVSGADPRTPDIPSSIGEFTDESDAVTKRKTLKQFNDSFVPVEHVRRGLNFDEAKEKEENTHGNGNNHVNDRKLSKSDQASDSEEILALKEAIAKLEAEKEAGLVQYQQSLDKLSQLETEISKTREDFGMLRDHANKAEKEVVALKEALAALEAEKVSKLQDYQQCVEKISNLQSDVSTAEEDAQKLNAGANTGEKEARSLHIELDKLASEKDEALNQYMQSLEIISNLESKLLLAKDDTERFKERAEKAESEVENLRQAISKLTEEKEAAAVQYQECLETISSLEKKLKSANEEAERLNGEIEDGVSKIRGAEEKCLLLERSNRSLHSELESLMLKMGTQNQELTEKQKELGRLWACIQEERLRFVEAETAFQTLQHLHAKTQEELRAMASELQSRAQLLKVAENQNQSLQEEVVKVKQENTQLDEMNTSSALSIKNMQNEISSLLESKGKLEEEAELRLDQRNSLQQEIYCLKEELNDLNKKHLSIMDQVHAVGLNSESLGSSVKELQDKNSSLKETCHRESSERAALVQKMVILEQLLEKNALLETSLSDLNAELDAVRAKMEELEQSCQSLLKEKSTILDEKATLMTQLQETTENLVKLSENNTVIENSLSDAHLQLEALQAKSKILEDSCQLLVNEKANLISEKEGLTSQLETTQIRLEHLGKLYQELEGRCMHLENEKESTLLKVEELQKSLELDSQEHASYIEMSESWFSGVQVEVHSLQEECQRTKVELDQVLDIAVANEIEIFVMRTTAQVLKENNCSLLSENWNLLEKFSLSGKKISQLEEKCLERQSEIKSLSDQTGSLRMGTRQLLKVLGIFEDWVSEDKVEQDRFYINQILNKLQNMKKLLCKAEEENLGLSVEFSVLVSWIKQLRLDLLNIEVEKNKVEHECKVKNEQVLQLQSEALALLGINEELRSNLREGDCHKEALETRIENLNSKLTDVQGICEVMQSEKLLNSKEKRSLMDRILCLEEKNNVLEEDNNVLCEKVLDVENLSFIFRRTADEILMGLRELGNDRNKLHEMNAALFGRLSVAEGRFEESKYENLHLNERLQRTEVELKNASTIRDQLNIEIENRKEVLHQMAVKLQEADDKISLIEKMKLEEKRSLTDRILCLEGKNNVLDEENNVLCDKVLDLENLSFIFRRTAGEILMGLRELGNDRNKLHEMNAALSGRLSVAEGRFEESQFENLHLKERLQKTEVELKNVAAIRDQLSIEIENGKEVLHQVALELQEAGGKISLIEKRKLEEERSLMDRILCLEEKNNVLEEENNVLCDEVLDLENHSFIFRRTADEILMRLRELQNGRNKLHEMNAALFGRLTVAEGRFEESKCENLHLKETLQNTEVKLENAATIRDQLSIEIENGREALHQMALKLQEADDKISLLEKSKLELNKSVEDLRTDYNGVKIARGHQENQILKLSTENGHMIRENKILREATLKLELDLQESHEGHNKSKTREENLHSELQNKINEMNEWENHAVSVFGRLQYSMINQLLYEQKFHELQDACLGYIDQNETLKTQLAAFGPEIVALKECISSLENQTDIHIKFQIPENEELQGAEVTADPCQSILSKDKKVSTQSKVSDLHDLRVRLQAIVKAAVEMKELMVQENIDLHSKLDASMRQLELLQSENGQYRRNRRPTTEITEAENALLTKDIVLDQVSDGSSYGYSKRQTADVDNQIVELCETADPDGTVGLTIGKLKKTVSSSGIGYTEYYCSKSMKKQKSGFSNSDALAGEEFSVDKSEISRRSSESFQEGNKRKVLERLDSDVQKLANLRITVQDLKRKLEVTEKDKRGKAVIESEALKRQLEEADMAIVKLFDLNGRLTKSIDNLYFADTKSSFDLEREDSTRRRRVSDQARRMSEKIGRLQLEVQKLQFVLLKMDDEREARSKTSETKRRILLRDYLYGGGRTGQRRKKHFCACVQPSTVEY